jgi:hypothetical protein
VQEVVVRCGDKSLMDIEARAEFDFDVLFSDFRERDAGRAWGALSPLEDWFSNEYPTLCILDARLALVLLRRDRNGGLQQKLRVVCGLYRRTSTVQLQGLKKILTEVIHIIINYSHKI